MGDWPDNMKVGAIREWPGAFTRSRKQSPFRYAGKPVSLTTTLRDLDTELRAVRAKNVTLLVAIDPAKFRRDGRPYANAQAEHPGVILSFEIPNVGEMSYPCDTFTTWEGNLRAVTLSLQALRKVDRYGVTKHGEQYQGFLAIEAPAAPAGFASADEALLFLASASNRPMHDHTPKELLRYAQQRTHPDRPGGNAAKFQRVSLADAKLREEGML